jgi:anti-anti-sigma factor
MARTGGSRPGELGITEHTEQGQTRVVVAGELDLATEPQLRSRLERLLERNARVLLDLRELTFIDSSGIRLIIEVDEQARDDGTGLRIVPGARAVQRIFAISGLLETLEFVEPD